MKETKKLIALRGACQAENNAEDIIRQVCAMYDELLHQNDLHEDDIVSIVFSITSDIDEKNPAAALRQGGKAKDLALFAVQEAAVKGGLERCIRILIHAYADSDKMLHHVYQNGAEVLRPDRTK
ncbi:MAG: chorismate mutase [Treponema sp.]|nr:chorismate mutase [Treponema sp.]